MSQKAKSTCPGCKTLKTMHGLRSAKDRERFPRQISPCPATTTPLRRKSRSLRLRELSFSRRSSKQHILESTKRLLATEDVSLANPRQTEKKQSEKPLPQDQDTKITMKDLRRNKDLASKADEQLHAWFDYSSDTESDTI